MPCACGLLFEMIDCLPQPETMAAPPTTMTATAYLVLEARRGWRGGGFTKYAVFRGERLAGATLPRLAPTKPAYLAHGSWNRHGSGA